MLEGDGSFCPVTVLTLIKQGSLETIFSPLFLSSATASVNTLSLRLNNLNGEGESTAANLACDECGFKAMRERAQSAVKISKSVSRHANEHTKSEERKHRHKFKAIPETVVYSKRAGFN